MVRLLVERTGAPAGERRAGSSLSPPFPSTYRLVSVDIGRSSRGSVEGLPPEAESGRLINHKRERTNQILTSRLRS